MEVYVCREAKSVLGNIVGDSGIDQLIRSLKSKKKENQRSAAILLASLVGNGTFEDTSELFFLLTYRLSQRKQRGR